MPLNKICFLLAFLFVLPSCDFIQKYRERDDAVERTQAAYKEKLNLEFEEVMEQNLARKNDFVEFILNQSTFEATSLDSGGTSVQVVTVSPFARHLLLEILKPIQGRQAFAFNFSDALVILQGKYPDVSFKFEEKIHYK